MEPNTLSAALVIDAIREPFVVIDAQYRIVAANRSYLLRNGYNRPQEVVGRLCYEAGRCRREGGGCGLDTAFSSGGEFSGSGVSLCPDGEERRCRRRCVPLVDAEGRVAYVGEYFSDVSGQAHLIAHSPSMRETVALLDRASAIDVPVLLLGPVGVGKERAARYLHEQSRRRRAPFVVVDCEDGGEADLDRELFGGEGRTGLVAASDGGTLLLKGIGGLPLRLQAKLVRLNDSGEYRRPGSNRNWRADVRVIAASTASPGRMVDKGLFRADLLAALSGVSIEIPPLSRRRADIPLLANHFLRRVCSTADLRFSEAAMDMLCDYPFPGNARELRAMVERAAVRAHGSGSIGPEHIESLPLTDAAGCPGDNASTPLLERRSGRLAASAVLEALERCAGHRGQAAKLLGISERTVYRYVVRLKGSA